MAVDQSAMMLAEMPLSAVHRPEPARLQGQGFVHGVASASVMR
jgi:hypothetical protein